MGTHVYFIRSGRYVKIGHAINPRSRAMEIRMHNPTEIELLGTIPVAHHFEERDYHQRFARFHHRGEWFRLTKTILKFIDAKCARGDPVKFMLARIVRAEGYKTTLLDLYEAYQDWCAREALLSLPYAAFETDMREVCAKVELTMEVIHSALCVRELKIVYNADGRAGRARIASRALPPPEAAQNSTVG